jgi:hypothetical protein
MSERLDAFRRSRERLDHRNPSDHGFGAALFFATGSGTAECGTGCGAAEPAPGAAG